ncbi:hypothetical protein TRAPUB_1392 [Trametes pubescens]|uniref:Uncharacterized protein n=1 Tax=Trametes pubescens TaxID=154538 RepID=A0A1M2VJL7_TRAPU|nr:hypothetical protein TRAPUB_1392 [Trametes pubescens]
MAHSELNRTASTASSITLYTPHRAISDLEHGSRPPASLSTRYPPAPHRHKPRAATPPRPSRTRLFLRNLRSSNSFVIIPEMCSGAHMVTSGPAVLIGRAILGPDSPAGLAVQRTGVFDWLMGSLVLGFATAVPGAVAWSILDARSPSPCAFRRQQEAYARHIMYVALWSCMAVFATQTVGALVNDAIAARMNKGLSPEELLRDPPTPPMTPEEVRHVLAAQAIGMGVLSPVLVLLYAFFFFFPYFREED